MKKIRNAILLPAGAINQACHVVHKQQGPDMHNPVML